MSTSSYVLAKDIGCSHSNNPYVYLESGIDVLFNNPNSLATSSKGDGTPVGAKTAVIMGFFANQVEKGGWRPIHSQAFHSLNSESCQNVFLPVHYSNTCYTNNSARAMNYNLGQIYLQNSFAFTFLEFPATAIAYEPTNPISSDSYLAPVFTDKTVSAIGIKHIPDFISPNNSKKFGAMIQLALQQAYKSTDFKGCCFATLLFICNVLDRRMPGWDNKNTSTGKWWKLYKRMYK